MRRTPSRPLSRPRGSLRGSPHRRLRFGFLVIAMVLSVFGARLVQLQGVDPHAYAAMAAAEGTVTLSLPAERGDILDRNGRPLADSVDGAMVVADPAMTRSKARELAKFLAGRLDVDYFETLKALRLKDKRFAYIARRVPASKAEDVVAAAEEAGFEGLGHPPRPGPRLPGRRRGRQPRRLHGHRRGARRVRAELQPPARRPGRLGAVLRRHRQPDPARPRHHRAAGRRAGPQHHHRPRPPVVRPARAPPDPRGRAGRLGVRGGPGHQDRRGARPRRRPDVRRPRPALRQDQGRPGLPGHDRRLRAGLRREGAHPERPHRRRQGHRQDPGRGAARPGQRRPRHPRLVQPRHALHDARRRDRAVLQHRHRARVAATSRPGSCASTSRSSASARGPTSASPARPRASCPTRASGRR